MWADFRVSDIKPTSIRAWFAQMNKDDTGPATIETATGLLRMVLDLAVEERRIATNPANAVKVPRRVHSVRGYLTYQQVEHLAREIAFKPIGLKGGGVRNEERPVHGTVVGFLAYTGLRFGEMAALKVSSIDTNRRRVFVDEAVSVSEVNGRIVWGSPKTHERRSVPYPDPLLGAALRELIADKPPQALVFAGEKGAILSVNTWRRRQFHRQSCGAN